MFPFHVFNSQTSVVEIAYHIMVVGVEPDARQAGVPLVVDGGEL